jgi:hypothetical protein
MRGDAQVRTPTHWTTPVAKHFRDSFSAESETRKVFLDRSDPPPANWRADTNKQTRQTASRVRKSAVFHRQRADWVRALDRKPARNFRTLIF